MSSQEALVGRDAELATVRSLVASAESGGGALLIRGEAGIGKSSLIAEAVATAVAAGFRVLRTIGVRTEANLPFAGLHQLIRPLLGDLGGLPVPQSLALGAAFGLTEGGAADPFLIALATLTLVTDAAAERPILMVIDDAQWLDHASDDVVAFIARRLGSDPVVLLAAVRAGGTSAIESAGLPTVSLAPLADTAARNLLDRRGRDFSPAIRRRILREAAGNPLALIELPQALGPDVDAGMMGALPVTDRVERAFSAQLADLPAGTQTMLLIAAVDETGLIDELLAAGSALGLLVGHQALKRAVRAGLISIDGESVRFRHPLIRSAIAQHASALERREVHLALAEVAADPDRAAWHLAAAATGPSEAVAARLDDAAVRADRRGALAVSVAALERAAQLSPDGGARGARLLRAADRAYALGRLDILARVLRDAEPLDAPALEERRLAWLQVLELEGPMSAREAAHIRSVADTADRALAEDETGIVWPLLHLAAARCWWTEADPSVRARVVDVARRAAGDPDEPMLMHVLSSWPSEHGAEVLERLHLRWASDEPIEPEDARTLATAALWTGDLVLAQELFAASVDRQRAQGRLGFLARAQVMTGWSGLHLGLVSSVRPALDEGARLAAETGQGFFVAAATVALASYHALRGDLDAAQMAVAEADRLALRSPSAGVLGFVRHARGMLELAAGRYADAFDELRRIHEPDDPAYHSVIRTWSVSDLVDAAIPSENADAARRYLDAIESDAGLMASPWSRIGMDYARCVLAAEESDGRHAEAAFGTALAADLDRWPLARARLLLAHGAWLRRQRRVVESRIPLRTARDVADAMGVRWLGERARQELGAGGESSRVRSTDSADELTPQELQIARLAAAGLTNREIGERLYLSHRTVGFHLYHVFPKLGISTRAQLHEALAAV